MPGSIFNPTMGTQTQMRPTTQLRLRGQTALPLIPPYQNKNKTVPPSPINPNLKKAPALNRTVSSPSTTTAPMFPDQILDNLYISDLETARAVLSPNYSSPGRPKIKYVLSLLDNAKDQPQLFTQDDAIKPDFVLKLIKLSDYNEVNMISVLPEACAFIRTSLANKDGGVLVHCRKGISRSGSIIIAYLMQELDFEYDAALKQAKSARNKIWPNRSFGEQLKMWHDLRYSLVADDGTEKTQYAEWRTKTRFRPQTNTLHTQLED